MQDEDRDLGLWRDDDLTWPRTSLTPPPHNHAVVVDDGMLNLVLHYGVTDFGRTLFIQELGAVAAKENERTFIFKFLLQILHVWEYM